MIYLSANDISNLVSMDDVIDAVDLAYEFYKNGSINMPPRMQVNEKGDTLLLMPCFTDESLGTKLVSLFPKNKNSPVIHGLVILNDSVTGEFQAILDGTLLTGLRTGAIGGSAVRHLASREASTLAIIGTGMQGLYQAIAACSERPITDIYLYNRTSSKVAEFITNLKQWLKKDIQVHTSVSSVDAISSAEIIITTTTSNEPVLPDDRILLQDKLVIGIGSFKPTMREFPESLYRNTNQIFVDTLDAIEESGDIKTPIENGWTTKESVTSFASHLSSKNKVSPKKGESVVFKSTGMALFDVVVATIIYQKALQNDIGIKLP